MLGKRIRIEELKEWKKCGNKIAIFCAGQNGYTFYRILQLLDIKVDCIVDNNKDKCNLKVFDDVKCFAPIFLSNKENYITYICIAPEHYRSIVHQAEQLNIKHIAEVSAIIQDIIQYYPQIYLKLLQELPYGKGSELFYNIPQCEQELILPQSVLDKNDKIAVYTSVFGIYDTIREPQYLSDNIDYYFVSDVRPESLDIFQWIDAKKFLPAELTSDIDKNRYIKMHPHVLFPEYKYSIYVDGNVEILDDISAFIQNSKTGISVFEHPYRDDIYTEALTVVCFKRANSQDVYKHMKSYLNDKMPYGYGLPEMRVLSREHNNPYCIKIMEDWWNEFMNKSKRDQLSFMYVMWKNGFDMSDLFILGKDMRKCKNISIYNHVK